MWCVSSHWSVHRLGYDNANQIRILQLCPSYIKFQDTRLLFDSNVFVKNYGNTLWIKTTDFTRRSAITPLGSVLFLHAVVCLYRLSSSVTRVGGQPPPDRVLTGRYVHSTLISLFCMDLMLLQLVFSFTCLFLSQLKHNALPGEFCSMSGLHCVSGAVYFWLASIDHSDWRRVITRAKFGDGRRRGVGRSLIFSASLSLITCRARYHLILSSRFRTNRRPDARPLHYAYL